MPYLGVQLMIRNLYLIAKLHLQLKLCLLRVRMPFMRERIMSRVALVLARSR